jgi:8-oxo-dGTP diphosphatase
MTVYTHARPRPDEAAGALAVLTNDRGEVLMHLRDAIKGIAWPGTWAMPAGGCEPGEAPRDTIVRELDEEAGLVIDDLEELGEIHDTWGQGRWITVYRGRYNGRPEDLRLTEGVKLQFFPAKQLDTLIMPPCITEALARALGAQPSARD